MKTKLKWKNILKLIVFIVSVGIIIYDLFMLLIYPFISGTLTSWTLFGFITFIVAVYLSVDIYEQIKNVSNTGTVKHTK